MAAPTKFAHVVFNTHRYQQMIDWYAVVFEARVQHQGKRLAFLTYDDEHHRFAFANLGPRNRATPSRASAPEPASTIWPTPGPGSTICWTPTAVWKAQGHPAGPPDPARLTSSMYYCDPDGNGLEFQVDL